MNDSFYLSSVDSESVKDELRTLEASALDWSHDVQRFLRNFSSVIRFAARSTAVPGYLLRDWIWIGSQLRVFASEQIVARAAGALILFVIKRFDRLRSGDERIRIDIDWATAHTISVLLDEVGLEGLRVFVSRDERRLAEDQWLSFYSAGAVEGLGSERNIESYLQAFDDVESECYLPDIANKVRRLVEAAQGDDDDSRWASAAIRYLLTSKDVVPDNLGYFGLVDDIFIVNQAYSMCCRQSPWLFLLDNFVREWPDLAKLIISTGADSSPLPQYVQAIVGTILHSLVYGPRTSCIVAPQVGSIALSSAFFATVVAARRDVVENTMPASISIGSHVVLTSARHTIRAIYRGTTNVGDRTFHMVELGKGVTQSLVQEYLKAMRIAPTAHQRLSSLKDFEQWRAEFSPIALEQMLSAPLSLDKLEPKVLVITQRNSLEQWLKEFRPSGKSPTEILGVRYFMRSGRWRDLDGTITSKPLLLVCNDTFTAAELLRSKDEGKGCGDLQWIIIDTPGVSGDISELLLALKEQSACRGVFVTGVSESELCRELGDHGCPQVYVAPDDAGVIGSRPKKKGTGPSSYYMAQIRCQSTKKVEICNIADENVQALYDLTSKMRSSRQEDGTLDLVVYSMSQLLRKIGRQFYPHQDSEESQFVALAESTVRLANLARPYCPDAARIIEALSTLDSTNFWSKKCAKIADLVSKLDPSRTALYCPSIRDKVRISRLSVDLFGIDATGLNTLGDLRGSWPWENLVIPGWFEKKQMRELRASGFAHTYHMILYPFEFLWEQSSAKAQHRLSRQLLNSTSDYAKHFESTYDNFSATGRWPKAETTASVIEDREEPRPFDHSETLVSLISRVNRGAGAKTEIVAARMVLFDDPEFFALLALGAKAICLPEDIEEIEESGGGSARGTAEALLSRPVRLLKTGNLLAFPLDHPGDVLDSLADEILENSPKVRRAAGLWRTSLREYADNHKLDAISLKGKLGEVGVTRHVATIRNWLFTESTVAPRSWRRVLPKIGKLTASPALIGNFEEVAQAVERIYQARREAAEIFLDQLRSAKIDTESGLLTAEIKGIQVHYRILRIARIERHMEVPAEMLGLQHIGELTGVIQKRAS